MKTSYYAIAGLLGAIGLVQLQLAVLSPAKADSEMTAGKYLSAAIKPAPAKSPARPGIRQAASRPVVSHAAAMPEVVAPIASSLPHLLFSVTEMAQAPASFGDAGILLASSSQASPFLDLPGDSQSAISLSFGEAYGATAAAHLAGAGAGGIAAGRSLVPALGEAAGFTTGSGIESDYFDSLSAGGGASRPSQDAFARTSMMSSVPDAETWATLVTGLALVGFSMRRRPRLRNVAS